MTSPIRKLEPVSLWNHFSNLNAVPRPSKKEERVIEFMVDFGHVGLLLFSFYLLFYKLFIDFHKLLEIGRAHV
jgi:hypothetical protein